MVDEVKKVEEVKTLTVWGLARVLAEQGYYVQHLNFSGQVYKKLFDSCLEQGLDLSLVLSYLYTIDSELVKEDVGVQSVGVPSDAESK